MKISAYPTFVGFRTGCGSAMLGSSDDEPLASFLHRSFLTGVVTVRKDPQGAADIMRSGHIDDDFHWSEPSREPDRVRFALASREESILLSSVVLLFAGFAFLLLLAACSIPSAAYYPEALSVSPTLAPEVSAELPGADPESEPGSAHEAVVPVDPRPIIFPTSEPQPDLGWRPPSYPAPWAILPQDHFYFSRPIPSGNVNWPNPTYRYGSTLQGEESIHTGIDLGAERGTSVMAAGDGEVIWVGYGLYRGIYDETDPYGLAVAIRHGFGYEGQKIYTVYAHMESIVVWEGQRVSRGEVIGTVGDTGHASGSHLHFEVRLGENRYFSTRNPELWMVPPEGWGVLVGKIKNTNGKPLEEFPVKIRSLESERQWNGWTYAKGTVRPDSFYDENFVISDLPAGPYEVQVDFAGHPMTAQFWLYPGQTNFITFHGRNGFVIQPSPTPVNLISPPPR
jgi:murein DD-endopeptidase MepM/ murein hydrolase activator NlpD